MRVRLTSEAEAELIDALRWYEGIRSDLGKRFLDEFEDLIGRLRDQPAQFPTVYEGMKRAGFRRFPYGLIFRILAAEVEIVACFHDRRDPQRWHHRW